MLKRGYYGTYHKMSFKHLRRYIAEFAARHTSATRHSGPDGRVGKGYGRQTADVC